MSDGIWEQLVRSAGSRRDRDPEPAGPLLTDDDIERMRVEDPARYAAGLEKLRRDLLNLPEGER